jgi:hypothetical protein
VKAWFRYIENCGGDLIFEADRIYAKRSTIHVAYLKNLAYTLNPSLLSV